MVYNLFDVKDIEQYLFDLTSVLLSPFFCSTHIFFVFFHSRAPCSASFFIIKKRADTYRTCNCIVGVCVRPFYISLRRICSPHFPTYLLYLFIASEISPLTISSAALTALSKTVCSFCLSSSPNLPSTQSARS